MSTTRSTHHEMASVRETLESIWVAIILAFVLRAFVLEAFVIPTGSMAPRLMGAHVLAACPVCHTEFQFGVQEGPRSSPVPICPNCSEQAQVRTQASAGMTGTDSSRTPMVLGGDRVLVLKYLYKFRPPQRWDVTVFRNPQTNHENFIKRLAGLPGEVVRIVHGDIFTSAIPDLNGDGVLDDLDVDTNDDGVFDENDDFERLTWTVAGKNDSVQQAMWQMLHDADYPPDPAKTTSRWQDRWTLDDGPAAWALHEPADPAAKAPPPYSRVFRYDGSAEQSVWFGRGNPELFKADNPYNPSAGGSLVDGRTDLCSDVKLQVELLPQEPTGQVSLALSNLEYEWLGEVNFDGSVRLRHRQIDPDSGAPAAGQAGQWHTQSATVEPLRVGRATRVSIEHADWRVKLRIDGQTVLESPEDYLPDVDALVERLHSDRAMPFPAPRVRLIGQSGRFELWHIQVLRDVFYTSPALELGGAGGYEGDPAFNSQTYGGKIVKQLKERPGRIPGWGTTDRPLVLRRYDEARRDLDEYFMLGDNSPASSDGRLWWRAAATLRLYADAERTQPQYRLGTVPQYCLIGKAFFVYWPAGRNLPFFNRLPILPNVGRMRWIR